MADRKENKVFANALDIVSQISQELGEIGTTVSAYVAGGMAVSWWLGEKRVSYDVDIISLLSG